MTTVDRESLWDESGHDQGRYTAVFLGFMALVCALTVIGIQIWITPPWTKGRGGGAGVRPERGAAKEVGESAR